MSAAREGGGHSEFRPGISCFFGFKFRVQGFGLGGGHQENANVPRARADLDRRTVSPQTNLGKTVAHSCCMMVVSNDIAQSRSKGHPLLPRVKRGSTFAFRRPHSRRLSRWAALFHTNPPCACTCTCSASDVSLVQRLATRMNGSREAKGIPQTDLRKAVAHSCFRMGIRDHTNRVTS